MTAPGEHDHEMWTQEFWDAKYAARERIWSGRVNPRLVEQVSDLSPASALDVGCGEGADAIWLAEQGWEVVGLDLSPVALERAAAHAGEVSSPDVASRITWQQADLLTDRSLADRSLADRSLAGPADLVAVHYLHLPPLDFERVYCRLAAAVAPGGSLLVVGHHPDDLDAGLRHPELPDLLFTPERVLALLQPDDWEVRVAEAPTRETTDRDGQPVVVTDTVVHAVRIG